MRGCNHRVSCQHVPSKKGIAEASLLAHIIVSKMVDHPPFYRQIEIFKRDFQWEVNSSTINDWSVGPVVH